MIQLEKSFRSSQDVTLNIYIIYIIMFQNQYLFLTSTPKKVNFWAKKSLVRKNYFYSRSVSEDPFPIHINKKSLSLLILQFPHNF